MNYLSKTKKSTKKPSCSQPLLLLLSVLALAFLMMMYMVRAGDFSMHEINSLANMITVRISNKNVGFVDSPSSVTIQRNKQEQVIIQRNKPEQSTTQVYDIDKQIISRKARIAFAITITKDGFFQDGAAVLAYSIMKNVKSDLYDISFIAFVHPSVISSRVGLTRLGFHVLEVPTPLNTSAIKFEFLREKMDKNGCCGAAELIKLTSYRYDVAFVSVDV